MPADAGRPRRGTATTDDFIESPATPTAPEPLRISKRSNTTSDISLAPSSSSSPPPLAAFRRPSFPAAGMQPDRPMDFPQPSPGLPRGQQQQQQQDATLGVPYESNSTTQAGSVGRHVSVVHSDAYPAPPPFRYRDAGRPARLRADSRSRTTPSPPQHQQPYRPPSTDSQKSNHAPVTVNPYPQFHQQYWPPPSRMTSTSTTAGRRGSPPPPETPATATQETPPFRVGDPPQGGRRPSMPSLTGRNPTRTNNTRPSPVLTQTPSPETATPPPRPWTPTEPPGSYPHGPPTVWHGTGGQNSEENLRNQDNGRPPPHARHPSMYAPEALVQELDRMNMSASPPPSYASLSHSGRRANSTGPSSQPAATATTAQGYPDEKRTVVIGAAAPDIPPTAAHPAFQHDPVSPMTPAMLAQAAQAGRGQSPENNQQAQSQPQSSAAAAQQGHPAEQQQNFDPPPQDTGPPSPPQLPEGWMAHLDANSGAYYYIHMATSHTQWEPPAVDTPPPGGAGPSNSQAAAAQPVQSPGFPPQTSGFPQTPGFPPQTPGFPAQTPGFPPQTPGFPPQTPGFPPQTPGFPPQTPGFAPQTPGFPPQTPGFAPQTPGFPPTPGFAPSMASPGFPSKVNPYDSMPPTPGFAPFQPPPPPIPTAGIVLYNPAPVNGEYFGPYLRYSNMNLEHGIWYGSILLVTEYQQPPTVHIHRSRDLSPGPPQLKAVAIYTHRTWTFFRYDIDLPMEGGDMWTYAISTPVGCTRFEFLVAGRDDRNWRFISHSCNDFGLGVKGEERARLGGHGFMWKDFMQKHLDCGGFHAQIGTGNQIYADRMWKEVTCLREWIQIRGKDNRKNAPWTAKHEEEVTHAYFHYYTSSWDQPHLREAYAQIPYLFQLDDHDIFDGFGSYPEYMQFSAAFKNIGRIGMHWYLLFQHHTTLDILHSQTDENDLFTITGTGWHFVKYMGPTIAIIGLDTRSERNQHQVMAGPTYQGIFPKIATLPASIQHAILVISVPVIYPRMDTAESMVATAQAGKKAVTGTYNLLGKLAGSAAGVIGAKEVVGSGFQSVKKAVGKHGLMGSYVNVFGEVELLDDLRDHWTHESKDLERTYLIRTLQGISHSRGLRISFLSGAVHLCGAGLVHDPNIPLDHKTMYQIICSSMVDAPPAGYMIKMLHNNKLLYVPQNGLRSTNAPSDTKEDMMEVFAAEVDGRTREYRRLMAKRGYTIFTAFDAEKGTSLAVDFMVQGEGVYAQTGKYGPVVVPRLEMGF